MLFLLVMPFLGLAQNEKVLFSVPGGFHEGSFFLELSNYFPQNHIRFTTNGCQPTATSRLYEGPMMLDGHLFSTSDYYTIQVAPENRMYYPDSVERCIVIRAAVFDSHENRVSDVFTNSYFIRLLGCDTHGLPVLSLCADSLDLYDFNRGILVPGVYFNPNNPDWSGNYFCHGIEWERLCNVEFYELDNTGINQQAGVRTRGGSSRYLQQKGLKIYAREQYGKKRFKHRFFPETSIESFKHLTLKPFSSTNGTFTGVQDVLAQRVARELDIDALACRQMAVFLNGEYYGIYSLEEVPDEHYLEDHYDVDMDSVNIIEKWFNLDYGDTTHWYELYQWLQEADLSLDTNFALINEKIDMNNFIDYLLFELYSFNFDWPTNNVRCWQEGNGKWRWIFYDGDACFHYLFDVVANATDTCNDVHPTQAHSTLLFRKLLENTDFVNRLTSRYYELNSSPLHPMVDSLFGVFRGNIEGEVPKQAERFNIPYSVERWETDILRVENFLQLFDNQLFNMIQGLLDPDNVADQWMELKVFPNPFNDQLTICCDATESKTTTLQVFNLLGQNVHTQTVTLKAGPNRMRWNATLAPGVYILKMDHFITKIVRQ